MIVFLLGVIVGVIAYYYFRQSDGTVEMTMGQSTATTTATGDASSGRSLASGAASAGGSQTARGQAGTWAQSGGQPWSASGQGATGEGSLMSRVRVGMPARSREGTSLGHVTEMHPEGADGARADATGYVRVENQTPGRREVLDLSVTEIIGIEDGHLIVERNRDAGIRPDQQPSPGIPGR
jgi:hypothetical protein